MLDFGQVIVLMAVVGVLILFGCLLGAAVRGPIKKHDDE